MSNLDQQIGFLLEADALKTVNRSNILIDHSRAENSAEHSWHVALWALVIGPQVVPGADIDRAIAMLLLHDLVEIQVGDHPIHLETDWDAVAKAEDAAAVQLFGKLPTEQGDRFLHLWREFEAAQSHDARLAKLVDTAQPMFQTLCGLPPHPEHCKIVRGNLNGGRAAALHDAWPEAAALAGAMLNNLAQPQNSLAAVLPFLIEADRLKSIIRATYIADASRKENSAEHSWHLALMALVLADVDGVDTARVVRMLILHDLVEIDAGDVPIFAKYDSAAMAAKEAAAADRIFGLLPPEIGQELRALWEEFEAAATPDAISAKSLDRFQPPLLNLASGGGSWTDYNVTADIVVARIGPQISKGAPWLWDWIRPQIEGFFANTASGA